MNNNRYWSRIIWHTMEELPEQKREIILRFNHGKTVMGYILYGWFGEEPCYYDNNYDDKLNKENIVAWGEFEFPSDWDYNKKED